MGTTWKSGSSCLRWVQSDLILSSIIWRPFPFCLALWDALKDYFLVYLPENEKAQIRENDRYNKIKSNLISSLVKIRLNFVLFLCETIFDRFLTWFQQEGPLIHLLHHELSELYRSVLLQFLKSDYVTNQCDQDLINLDFQLNEKQLAITNIRIGELMNSIPLLH